MKYVHMSTSSNCSKPEMAAVMPTNHSPLQIYRQDNERGERRVSNKQAWGLKAETRYTWKNAWMKEPGVWMTCMVKLSEPGPLSL